MVSWPRVSRDAKCYNLSIDENNPRQWKDSGMSNISVNDVVKVFKRHRLDNGNLSVWSADGNEACVMVGAPHGNHILLEYLPLSSMQAALSYAANALRDWNWEVEYRDEAEDHMFLEELRYAGLSLEDHRRQKEEDAKFFADAADALDAEAASR